MSWLRSVLFAGYFYGGTAVFAILYLPILLLPRRAVWPFVQFWVDYAAWGIRHILRIRETVVGPDGKPAALEAAGPAIVASKHQSAWETLVFNRLLHRPAFVLKRELLYIPLFGWYLRKTGQIAIDRSAGPAALKAMVNAAETALSEGRSVVIYPQGTRVGPGVEAPYRPGVAALYRQLGRPVLPIALNSGRLWGRNAFRKRAGRVTVAVLPAIAPGLNRADFMRTLESRIETACRRLDAAESGESGAVDRIVE